VDQQADRTRGREVDVEVPFLAARRHVRPELLVARIVLSRVLESLYEAGALDVWFTGIDEFGGKNISAAIGSPRSVRHMARPSKDPPSRSRAPWRKWLALTGWRRTSASRPNGDGSP
jgi:hypothetical protein